MKQQSLTRRLIAGSVGLMIGLMGAAAFSTPAQATGSSSVGFKDNCDGTFVTVNSGSGAPADFQFVWTITPTHGDPIELEPLSGGESYTEFLPNDAGEISVDYADSPGFVDLPKTHTWEAPRHVDCDAITIDVTQPTCEDPNGYITIPAISDELPGHFVYYLVDGEDEVELERGETYEAEPGTYLIRVYKETERKKLLKEFWVEIVPADCPDDEEEEEENGEGGELPETGIATGLIALSAVVLLALGGGLYLVARRRRVTFTT